jgi:MFS family permease
MALFLGSKFLPALISPAFVAKIESTPPRFSLPTIYLAEAGAFALLAILAHHFSLLPVVVLAAIDGTLALAGRSLTRAVVVALLEPAGELRSGNAVLNLGFTAGSALGPALAGVIVGGLGAWSGFGIQTALLLDAVSFLTIAVILFAGPLPLTDSDEGRWKDRFRAGLAYVGARLPLRRLLFAQGVAFIFFTAPLPIEVIYVKSTLGSGDSGYGALLASWGVGMVLGGVVFARLRKANLPLLLFGSVLVIGASYLGLAAAPTLLVACAISVIGGAGNGVEWVAVVSAIQEMTRSEMQARVMSVLESVGAAMPGVGFLVGGLIAAGHNARTTFLVSGLGVLVVLAFATRSLAGTPWTRGEGAIGPSGLDEEFGVDMLKIDDPAASLASTGGPPDPEETEPR